MTIKSNETGLTYNQYAAIANAKTNAVFKIVAHRYNLDFELHSTGSVVDNLSADFDVIQLSDGTILKVADLTMEKWNIGTNAWTTVTSFPTPTNPLDTRMAITYDGATITAYCCTLSGLLQTSSTDNGVTWSAWATFYGNPSGSPSGYAYGSDITGTASAVGGTGALNANAYDNDANTIWVSTSSTGSLSFTFAATRNVTKYTVTAPTASHLDRAPRSWQLYADSTLVHSVVTPAWTAGETRTFYIQSAESGTGLVGGTVWQFSNIQSFNGQPPCIGEVELMQTTTVSVAEITQVGSGTPERVHFVVRDNAKMTHNFAVSAWNGSGWTTYTSPIYWPFDIESFEVLTLANGTDVMMLTTHLPGILTKIANGTETEDKFTTAGGVIAFTYKDGIWSDHVNIDVVDALSDYRWRDFMKASLIGDTIYLTCYSSEGTELYPFEAYRCYKSQDGVNWSIGDILPFPETVGGYGVEMLLVDDYVYAFEKKNVYRSRAALYVDHSPVADQVNLTPYIMDFNFTHSRAMQSRLKVVNIDGMFDDHALINHENTIILYVYAGAPYSGTLVYMPIAILEVDSLEFSNSDIVDSYVNLSARDKFSWLSDRTASEQSIYRKSQIQGGDNYWDFTDTAYGGMSHTARQTGSFKTIDGWLVSQNSGVFSVAFSTFDTNLWNGSIAVGIRFSSINATDWGGICFRGIDSDNVWYAMYYYNTDKIEIWERRDGNSVMRAASSAMGWSGTANITRYLRVEIRYAKVDVYVSSDSGSLTYDGGRTWTHAVSHIMDASRYIFDGEYLKQVSEVPYMKGYYGVASLGSPGIKFWRLTLADYSLPNTIQESINWYSALASLKPPSFDKLYRASSLNWTLDSGLDLDAAAIVGAVWGDNQGVWGDGLITWE